jgi:copper chaperone CopZ
MVLGVFGVQGVACEQEPLEPLQADMRQALFLISDLTTHRGVQEIRRSLRRIQGVTKVMLDLPNSEVLITFDANLASELGIESVIKQTGYPCRLGTIEMP